MRLDFVGVNLFVAALHAVISDVVAVIGLHVFSFAFLRGIARGTIFIEIGNVSIAVIAAPTTITFLNTGVC